MKLRIARADEGNLVAVRVTVGHWNTLAAVLILIGGGIGCGSSESRTVFRELSDRYPLHAERSTIIERNGAPAESKVVVPLRNEVAIVQSDLEYIRNNMHAEVTR